MSKIMWLKDSNKNSKFVHAKASSRRKRNRLITLQNDVGEWMEGNQFDAHIVDYFQSLFSANTIKGPIDFQLTMERRVTDAMNENLTHDFIEEEINVALKQMHATKALRPNGMPSIFY